MFVYIDTSDVGCRAANYHLKIRCYVWQRWHASKSTCVYAASEYKIYPNKKNIHIIETSGKKIVACPLWRRNKKASKNENEKRWEIANKFVPLV